MNRKGFIVSSTAIAVFIVLVLVGVGGYVLIGNPFTKSNDIVVIQEESEEISDVNTVDLTNVETPPAATTTTTTTTTDTIVTTETKGPEIVSLSSDKTQVISGEAVTISWEVAPDTTSIILSLSCDTGVTWSRTTGTATECGEVLSQEKPAVATLYRYFQVKLFNGSSSDKSVTATLKAGNGAATSSKDITITVNP